MLPLIVIMTTDTWSWSKPIWIPVQSVVVSTNGETVQFSLTSMRLNPLAKQVFIHDTTSRQSSMIQLNEVEFRLLAYFMQNKDVTLTRRMLTERALGRIYTSLTDCVDVHIHMLRAKLQPRIRQPLIHTVRGLGYRFGEQ
jgi:two-component system OmpR family response regulator